MQPMGKSKLGLFVVLLSGCVERTLYVMSDPSGATVYVDGEKAGATPAKVRFLWYGKREIMLEKQSYRTVKTVESIYPPWWQIFPFDFLTDVVLLYPLCDERTVRYTLEEAKLEQDREGVRRRAHELKAQLEP